MTLILLVKESSISHYNRMAWQKKVDIFNFLRNGAIEKILYVVIEWTRYHTFIFQDLM